MKTNYLIYAMLIIGLFTSCGTEDEPIPPVPLLAVITNTSQTVAPFTEVTLDGSGSTGPEGFRYEWIYQGSETVNLSSTSDPIVTFTPEKNTFYSFVLRLTTSDGQFNEAIASVTVTGAVILDASSFTSDVLELKDIEIDQTMPDYLINADFTILTGKTLNIGDNQDVTIGFADGTGMIIYG